MKKRVLSLILTLAMALSLAVPALALEPPAESETLGGTAELMEYYTFTEQYLADHPEIYESFDPDAYYLTQYYGCSKEDYMALTVCKINLIYFCICKNNNLSYKL